MSVRGGLGAKEKRCLLYPGPNNKEDKVGSSRSADQKQGLE